MGTAAAPARGWRAGILGTALVGLLAMAAAASRTHPLGEEAPALPARASSLLLDSALYLVLALDLLSLVLVLWALWPDPEAEAPALERRGLLRLVLSPLAMVAVVGLLVWGRSHLAADGFLPPQAGGQGGPTAAAGLPHATAPPSVGFDWAAGGLAAALLVAAAVWGILLLAQVPCGPGRYGQARAARDVALVDGLGPLGAEADPRRAVIAAYARAELVAGAHGLARRPFETPLEYLARLLGEPRVPGAEAARLTWLFERAKFSLQDVDAAMRADAIACFEAIRRGLQQPAPPTGLGA